MSVRPVALRHTRPRWAALHPLRGADEEAVTAVDTRAAITLLDRLLADVPGTGCRPGEAAALAASDRDRLLAAVYADAYGSRITGTVTCRTCAQAFDLSFTLDALLAHRDREPPPDDAALSEEDDPGAYRLPSGLRFRLPTGADELAVAALPADEQPAALLTRIAPEAGAEQASTVEEALEAVAPLLDLDLAATCPECSAEQTVPFDVQRYLLERLRGEWQARGAEIHRIASAYRWGLGPILDLTRRRRRDFVQLIEAELPSARTRSTWPRTFNV